MLEDAIKKAITKYYGAYSKLFVEKLETILEDAKIGKMQNDDYFAYVLIALPNGYFIHGTSPDVDRESFDVDNAKTLAIRAALNQLNDIVGFLVLEEEFQASKQGNDGVAKIAPEREKDDQADPDNPA